MFVKIKKNNFENDFYKAVLEWTADICPAYRLFSWDVYPLMILGFCQKSKEIYV